MDKLINIFINNLEIIFFVIAVVCFIIPILYIIIKRKKRKIKSDILDRHAIMMDSGVFNKILLILFLLVFFIVGVIIICVSINTTKIVSNMIFEIIFGLIFCLIPVIISFNIIRLAIKVLTGKYAIVLDELMDKDYYIDHSYDGEGTDLSCWRLYFKDFFKTYNKYVKFKDLKEGNKYKKGDKFYLVFVKGNSIPYMFAANEYNIATSEIDKLRNLDEIEKYINLKKFVLPRESLVDKIIIDKKQIKKDFTKQGHLKTAIIFSLCCLGLFVMLWLFLSNLTAFIVVLIVSTFLTFLTFVKIRYVYEIYKNINKGKIIIKKDEVISLNNQLQFKDSNSIISFKFKNYKKIVYNDRAKYADAKIGDEFFLIFIKGESNPINVYSVKNSTLSADVNLK